MVTLIDILRLWIEDEKLTYSICHEEGPYNAFIRGTKRGVHIAHIEDSWVQFWEPEESRLLPADPEFFDKLRVALEILDNVPKAERIPIELGS